jgi:hypothetical protein
VSDALDFNTRVMRILIASMPMIALAAILSASASQHLQRQAATLESSEGTILPETEAIIQKVYYSSPGRRATHRR